MDLGWSRRHNREHEVAAKGRAMYCFAYIAPGSGAEVWLSEQPTGLRVANVVSLSRLEMGCDEHNHLIAEFNRRFAAPAALEVGAEVHVGKAEIRLEDLLTPKATHLLKAFTRDASRTVLDYDDVSRWSEFLSQVHRDGTVLLVDTLEELLVGDEGMPEHIAHELAGRYNQGMQLLRTYDPDKKAA